MDTIEPYRTRSNRESRPPEKYRASDFTRSTARDFSLRPPTKSRNVRDRARDAEEQLVIAAEAYQRRTTSEPSASEEEPENKNFDLEPEREQSPEPGPSTSPSTSTFVTPPKLQSQQEFPTLPTTPTPNRLRALSLSQITNFSLLLQKKPQKQKHTKSTMSTTKYNDPLPGAPNAPRFNAKDPQSSFRQYIEAINFLTSRNGITDAKDKFPVFMRYATDEQKEEWECLDEYIATNYDGFVKTLKAIYGQSDDELKYSQRTWDELIQDYALRPCNSSASFGKFMLQVRPQILYLEKHLQITNYLAVRDISKCVDIQVWKEAISRLKDEEAVKKAAATNASPYTGRPSTDPFTAVRILSKIYEVFREQERIATFVSVANVSPLSASMPVGRSPMGIKVEDVDIKLEQFMQEQAKYRDKQSIQTNQLQTSLDTITQLLQNSQIKNHNVAVGRNYTSPPQQYGSGSNNRPQTANNNTSDKAYAVSKAGPDQCLGCELEGHRVRDCMAWQELRKAKKVKPAPNRLGFLTGDGQQILESWPGRTIIDKVNKYYKNVNNQSLADEFEDEDEDIFTNGQNMSYQQGFDMVQ